ncbi:MAG: hypothetical protein K2N84_01320 [Clostridia bacterium]|nr:hypothetical protein [Clostridia bacterium]
MAKAQKQRNKEAQAHGPFFSRPLDFSVFGLSRPNASTRLAVSSVRSLSVGGDFCEFTQKQFADRYHVSCATAARCFKKLVGSSAFERGEKRRQYKYVSPELADEGENKEYIRIYDWTYHAHFEIGKIRVQLTTVQVEILSFIRGYTLLSRDRITKMSRNWIAKKLGISGDCVSKAVRVLEAMSILFVTEQDGLTRSVNASTRTTFQINEVLWKQKERETLKRRARKPSEPVHADEPDTRTDEDRKIDRARYYAQREAMEEARRAAIEKELERDELYKSAAKALRADEPKIEKARHNHNSAELMRLLERRVELQKQKRERMQLFGYTEQDFLPQYLCAECKDTGNRADGTFCDCWERLRR